MKFLFAVFITLTLCGCASELSSRQLIEVGESCAAIGRGIVVNNAVDNTHQPWFYKSYQPTEMQVTCR
ncbi:MAG: hypothetical protein ABI343_00740 [Burkholderiaceae bacterium]